VKPAGNLLVVVHTWVDLQPDPIVAHAQRRAAITDVKDEYDFSVVERGKFYRQDAVLVPPVHLDPKVLAFLSERAQAHCVPLNELINTLQKNSIALLEATDWTTTGPLP
jgi:hypothetical protein